MPNVYDFAIQFQQALLSRDRAAAARLTTAYGLAFTRLSTAFNQISADITAARDRGEQITEAWLLKQARYRELLRQTGEELLRLAQFSEGLITAGQQIEIERATRDARQLMAVAADEAGVEANFAQLPKGALEKIVGTFADGSPLSKLFRNLPAEGQQQIQQALIEGVAMGQGPRAVARKMRDAFGGNLDRALRVARTEQIRAYREATRENYQRNSDVIQGWQWLSARQPGRTCPVCWAMDGQIFPLNTPMGSHVNCRCTQLPVIDAAPLQETGEQIFRRLRDDQIKDLLGPKKYAAYKAGEISLRDLVAYRKDARWGEQRTERSLKDALAGKGKQVWGKLPKEFEPATPEPTPAEPLRVIPALSPEVKARIQAAKIDAENVSVPALGLAHGITPVMRGKVKETDITVDIADVVLSRDVLNESRLLALEKQLAGGVKKQKAFNITVTRDPKTGKYIVSADGNHRAAYLQLVGYRGPVAVRLQEAKAAVEKKPVATANKSLAQFIKEEGGIKPSVANRGELAYASTKESRRVGIVNKKGIAADEMRRRAIEAGYGEWVTESEFLSALRDDVEGRKIFSIDRDVDYEAEYKKSLAADEQGELDAFNSFLDDPDAARVYDRVSAGDFTIDDIRQLAELAEKHGLPDDAVEAIVADGEDARNRRG